MTATGNSHEENWRDALLVASVLAVDPAGLGGAAIRSPAGQIRKAWLTYFRSLLPAEMAYRRIPQSIHESRLIGGLDLSATLARGCPVAEKGLLAQCHQGVAIAAMAERMVGSTAAQIAAVMDLGIVVVERDGIACREPATFGLVLLDEGIDADEISPAVLRERVAFQLDLDLIPPSLSAGDLEPGGALKESVAIARSRWPQVSVGADAITALTTAAWQLGVPGLRAPLLALAAARAHAALAGRNEVAAGDLTFAGSFVLAPRATRLPAPAEPESAEEQTAEQPLDEPSPKENAESEGDDKGGQHSLQDQVLEAAESAIPQGLLQVLMQGRVPGKSKTTGKAGSLQRGAVRGRPVGAVAGNPRSGARLHLLATLRAAAPWQPLRRRDRGGQLPQQGILVRREDFRVHRFQQRAGTTTVFVVDASGSSALHRLAEAKGAVELMLADCYVRRDRVAVIAFRGRGAETLLPPTRSLVRAKRSLAALPGGGGTPLAAGIDGARLLAASIKRQGETPVVVLLTDGRANIGRDGVGGREQAQLDALASARGLRTDCISTMVIDTSPSPQPNAAALALAMGAAYQPLPHAGARALTKVVKQVSASLAGNHTNG
jgi:magnesium chelatase subunit D